MGLVHAIRDQPQRSPTRSPASTAARSPAGTTAHQAQIRNILRGSGADSGTGDSVIRRTTMPESTMPESTLPESTMPESTMPESTMPESTLPESTLPESTMPESTLPEPETCPPPEGMSCTPANDSPVDVTNQILFPVNSATLNPTQRLEIDAAALSLRFASQVRVDGYASPDGPCNYNWDLSCRRAMAVAAELYAPSDGGPGVPAGVISMVAHGESLSSGTTLAANRNATISMTAAPGPGPGPGPGPTPAPPTRCNGSFSDGHNVTSDPDHDLDQLHHSGERSPDIILYDIIGGESGAWLDYYVGYFAGTSMESTSDDDRLYHHFMSGSGSRMTFSPSSDMARIIGSAGEFTRFATRFELDMARYMARHGNICGYPGDAFILSNRPGYFSSPIFAFAVMGGYSRIQAEVTHTASGLSIEYRIFDHYGAGVSDAWSYLPGLSALYYLQHFHGVRGVQYTPFIWSVKINRTVP